MGKKKCTTCGDDKDLNEFNKNKSKKDGYNNICRICSNARSKQYYQENRDHHKQVIVTRNKRNSLKNRIKLFEYLNGHPCIDCGNDDPIVLEFDHRDDVDKLYDISAIIRDRKWETIKAEIDKCDVRCANCHRIRTAKQLGYYKGIIEYE